MTDEQVGGATTDFADFDAAFNDAIEGLAQNEGEKATEKAAEAQSASQSGSDTTGGEKTAPATTGEVLPAAADAAAAVSSEGAGDKPEVPGEKAGEVGTITAADPSQSDEGAATTTAAAAAARAAESAAETPDYQKQTVDLLEKLVQKDARPVEPAPEKADPDPGFKLTTEQTELLKKFDEEWPEVAPAVELRTQMVVYAAMGTLIKQLRTELAPVITHYAQTYGDSHVSAIKSAHEDYEVLTPKLIDWIKTQPPGLRTAYTQIAQAGSAQDVIGLFNVYKKANGIGMTPQESSTGIRVTVKEPSPTTKKAAESLTVIPGKRSVIPSGPVDKDDFEGGWKEATRVAG